MGHGTRFRVYLPVIAAVKAARDSEKPAPPRGNGEVILIVEDEGAIREILSRTLQRYGHEVLLAAEGAEALATNVDGPQVRVIASNGLSSNRRAVESRHQNRVRELLMAMFNVSRLVNLR